MCGPGIVFHWGKGGGGEGAGGSIFFIFIFGKFIMINKFDFSIKKGEGGQ